MSEKKEEYSENKLKNQIVQEHCVDCKRETRHMIMTSFDYSGSEFSDYHGWSIDWSSSHQVIQCQGCMASTFRQVNWFSEDQHQIGPDEWDDGERVSLYPKRNNQTVAIKDFWEVPNNLRKIYRESLDCFNSDSLILSAAGLRAVLDGLCAALNIEDGPVEITKKDGKKESKRFNNLAGKISGLHEKGFLTKQNSDILHEHRYMGNDAVHELESPSKDELKLAINIIEHAFETIFEIPQKGEELRLKRAKRSKKS